MIEKTELEPDELVQDIDTQDSPDNEQPKKKKRLKRGDANYVNNAELLVEFSHYREAYDIWKESDEDGPRPRMSQFLGEMISKIAHRAVFHPKWVKFPSIREEMVSDAIANVMAYGHNFNHKAETRSGAPNPFGYVTQICNNAYMQRITREKRQFMTKAKWVQSSAMREQIEQIFDDTDGGSTGEGLASMIRMYYNVDLPNDSMEKHAPIESVDDDGNVWVQYYNHDTEEYNPIELLKAYEFGGLEHFYEE